MTEVIEDIPTMTAIQQLLQLLERDDVDSWRKADAMKLAVEDGWTHPSDSDAPTANSGLHVRIAEVWGEVVEDDEIGEKPAIHTMAGWYNTARGWPEETRVKGASYMAHYRLSGWPDRQGALSKLVSRKRKGIVNEDDVRRWKQEQEGRKPPTPWEEKFYKRLDSVVHSQTFNIETPDEMRTAIKLIRTLVGDLQNELEEMEDA